MLAASFLNLAAGSLRTQSGNDRFSRLAQVLGKKSLLADRHQGHKPAAAPSFLRSQERDRYYDEKAGLVASNRETSLGENFLIPNPVKCNLSDESQAGRDIKFDTELLGCFFRRAQQANLRA
jgi:hypothetical protein